MEPGKKATSPGTLYFAASHIGCLQDIPQRTLEILQKADLLVFEEARHARQLLKQAGVHRPYLLFSEHKEADSIEAVKKALTQRETVVYVSDQGCPNLADPGRELLELAYQRKAQVRVIPGPSSITSALAVCPFDVRQFFFAGFLPREPDKRRATLRKLSEMPCALVILDTPYRRQALLQDVETIMSPQGRHGFLAVDISGEAEQYLLGTFPSLRSQSESLGKENFVLIIGPRK